MIQTITPSTALMSTPAPLEVKVFGVHQVVATEQQQQQQHQENKKLRRRRRRHNRSSPIAYQSSDDSSTCATVSSDSTGSTSSSNNDIHHGILHQRLDLDMSSSLSSSSQQKTTFVKKKNRNINKKKQTQKNINNNVNNDIPLHEQDKYIGLDCEMVGVGYGGHKSSVARVTLVAWDGSIVLDEMVKQDQDVTDYRTFVSGITKQDLETANYTLTEIRQEVQTILKDKILVGHALKNDLRVLGISHPWYDTRDTAKYEPFMQVRFNDGILWPKKLSELVKTRLHRDIQQPGVPHSSYEDAVAAMDLYKLVRRKWEKAMEYKINKTKEILEHK